MKYMILMYGSQRDYDLMSRQATDGADVSAEDFAPMHAFMAAWNSELVESGEFVDAQGLTAPVHARRIRLRHGARS